MGSQTPTAHTAPEYTESDGLKAAQILKAGKLVLDPWQADILDDWLAKAPSGRWAASTCGGSVARQNGKTLVLQGRAACGMLMYGEQVIYTAHLQKTATETFEELRDFFETASLKKYVQEIRTALGREQILLKNGARMKFLARTRNGGRGQHGDLLVFDEAQELDEQQQASFLPAISASSNPQTIYVGTPPDPGAVGTVFRKIRDRANEGKSEKTAWFEFSVDEIGDVSDRKRWAATNPALGRRILESTIAGEFEQMDADTFARERLGWWTPPPSQEKAAEPAIPLEAWEACRSSELKPEGKTAYGVRFTSDGAEVVLAGAVCPANGKARVTIIDRRPTGHGTRWLAEWLNERYGKACCVAIDGRNGVDILVDRIADTWRMKGTIVRPRALDVVAAASLIIEEINEGSVTWFDGQEMLDNSARTSTKRPISGGFGFGGSDPAPIEAAALALWACRMSKRDPTKKMRIG